MRFNQHASSLPLTQRGSHVREELLGSLRATSRLFDLARTCIRPGQECASKRVGDLIL
jgi:hypothetical protein